MKEKTEIYKKWWFWIIIVLLISFIIETTFLIITLKNRTKDNENINSSTSSREELMALAKQINTTLGHSNVYFSSDGSYMYVEIRNWKNEYNETKLKDFLEILNSDYCRTHIDIITIVTYFEPDINQDPIVIRKIYKLKDWTELQKQETYVDFDTYSNLLTTFDNASN